MLIIALVFRKICMLNSISRKYIRATLLVRRKKNYSLLHRNGKWNTYKKEVQKLCCIVCTFFYLHFIITFEYVSFYLGYMVVHERNTTFVNSLAKNSEALNSSKNKRIKYSGNNALVYRTPNASECQLTNYLSSSEIILPCL